jgi:pilus assembly protein CpaF
LQKQKLVDGNGLKNGFVYSKFKKGGPIVVSLYDRIKSKQINSSEQTSEADETIQLIQKIRNELLLSVQEIHHISMSEDLLKQDISEMLEKHLHNQNRFIPKSDKEKLIKQIIQDVNGLGPLQPLLEDESISEIMVNGPKQIYIEKSGKIVQSVHTFQSNEHVLNVLEKILSPLGRRLDESSPMVDARLKDGSRVNAIIPPLALNGPTITIRKFRKDKLTIDDLVKYNSISQEMANCLKKMVVGRKNILVAGGTGSGKTTLLNILSSFIPEDERIITIEDAAELQLNQPHVLSLETRPPNIEGKGEITIRDLVRNSLRMRPDRIIIGEVRGGESLDMLQAMNTGHDGSLSTIHANTPRDVLSRLETLILMAGFELPIKAIRQQISSSIDTIVIQKRFSDGSRKITHITTVEGMEGEIITLNNLFEFQEIQSVKNGMIKGKFVGSF